MAWQSLIKRRQVVRPWGILLVVGAAMLPAVKVLDRANSLLRNKFDITLSNQVDAVVSALEEGTEMLLPLIFLVAVGLYLMGEQRTVKSPVVN